MDKSAQLIKSPAPPDPAKVEAVQKEIVDVAKRLALAAAGTAIGFRGLLGLRDLLAYSPMRKRKPLREQIIDLPILPYEEKTAGARTVLYELFGYPAEKAWRWTRSKLPDVSLSGIGQSLLEGYAQYITELPKAIGERLVGALSGQYAPGWWAHPLGIPAASLGVIGGGYAGWKLIDYLMDKQRKKKLDEELSRVQREYVRALQRPPEMSKESSAEGNLDVELDRLYDVLRRNSVKIAQNQGKGLDVDAATGGATSPEFLSKFLGPTAGIYLTTAALLSYLLGREIYAKRRALGSDKILEKARQQHLAALSSAGLGTPLLRPVPVQDEKQKRRWPLPHAA